MEPSVAELIDQLFKTHKRPDGKEFSCNEVSRALKEIGEDIDPSYIAKVRRGEIKNPGREALKLLCIFFRVPPSYFFPELEVLEGPKEGIHPMLLLRGVGLKPEDEDMVTRLIQRLIQKKD